MFHHSAASARLSLEEKKERQKERRQRESMKYKARVIAKREAKRKAHPFRSPYVMLSGQQHPLARKGALLEHIKVLYDKIGPGPHSCHWCGRKGLQWGLGFRQPDALTVDHLNWDPTDNRPENLVPACWPCNKGRKNPKRDTRAKRVTHPRTEAEWDEWLLRRAS